MRTFTKIRFVVATLVALALAPFSAHAQFVGGNATLSAGTVSSNVALPANTVTYPYVLIVPAEGSSNEVFYKLGLSSSVVATTSGPALPAGGVCINSGPNTYLAGITGSSTTTVRVTQVTLCPIYSGGAGAGGGGGGGTSSNFSSAFPSVGTAVGFSNGTNMVPGLVDGSGYLEVNVKAGGAGGGAVYGPTAVGSATANPPVSVGGSVDGTSTGNVGIWKVNSSGLGFVSATVTNWGSGSNTLGAMANYGTSPGAVLVPGVNAFVTNSVAVTGTFWQATQPVSGTFWQATQPVSGTFWQATQPISGTVTANLGTLNGAALASTQGTTADAPCTLPATSTACSEIALQKAIANAALNGTGATASGVPLNAVYLGVNVGGNLVGMAPGTAGTPGSQVWSAQGVSGMTPLAISRDTAANGATHGLYSNLLQGDAVLTTGNPLFVQLTTGSAAFGSITNTTFAATQATASALNATVVGTGTFAVQAALVSTTNAGATVVKGGVGVVNGGSFYETVAASQTAQVLQSSTGATGDYLSHCTVIPTSTSPGVVTILDNSTAIYSFPGGASSLSNLVPWTIPVGAVSASGAWKVTTGASLSVVCVGKFS